MQPVDDVDFGEGLMGTAAQLVPDLLERHRVRARITRLEPRERAEEAAGDTDVGRLEADVEVVVRPLAVTTFALAVGEPAKRQQVGAGEQPNAVLEIEAHPRLEPLVDRCEAEPLQPLAHAGRCHSGSHKHSILLKTQQKGQRPHAILGASRRPREVGASPTRCRHCKRGAPIPSRNAGRHCIQPRCPYRRDE